MKTFTILVLLMLAIAPSGHAASTWQLEAAPSEIVFVAVKDDALPVAGKWTTPSGTLEFKDGRASGAFQIDLSGLDSGNPGRDYNIVQTFFQVATKGQTATFTIDTVLGDLSQFGKKTGNYVVAGHLELAGVTAPVSLPVLALPVEKKRVQVVTTAPVALRFADFGLGEAAAALKKVCGHLDLLELATVSLNLRFVKP